MRIKLRQRCALPVKRIVACNPTFDFKGFPIGSRIRLAFFRVESSRQFLDNPAIPGVAYDPRDCPLALAGWAAANVPVAKLNRLPAALPPTVGRIPPSNYGDSLLNAQNPRLRLALLRHEYSASPLLDLFDPIARADRPVGRLFPS